MLFQSNRHGYLDFMDAINDKTAIKSLIDAEQPLKKILDTHHENLNTWWMIARNDFAD